jgi:hypothetical protein
MIFQRFSQNKYKRKRENHLEKWPGRPYVWFEKIREELCPVFQFREKKLTFTIIEGDKVDFFQPTISMSPLKF